MVKTSAYYADRLYNLAISDPAVDALSEHEIVRYIRHKAEVLCLDWRDILDEVGDVHPDILTFKAAAEDTTTRVIQ